MTSSKLCCLSTRCGHLLSTGADVVLPSLHHPNLSSLSDLGTIAGLYLHPHATEEDSGIYKLPTQAGMCVDTNNTSEPVGYQDFLALGESGTYSPPDDDCTFHRIHDDRSALRMLLVVPFRYLHAFPYVEVTIDQTGSVASFPYDAYVEAVSLVLGRPTSFLCSTYVEFVTPFVRLAALLSYFVYVEIMVPLFKAVALMIYSVCFGSTGALIGQQCPPPPPEPEPFPTPETQ